MLLNTKTALYKANVAITLSQNLLMAPCKRQVKATRHLICNSCSYWVDFVKSGCEKSWAEVQADSVKREDIGRQDERRREGKKWEGRQMDLRKGEWGDSREGVGGQGNDN